MDRYGLLVEGMADITPAQVPFVQSRDAAGGWTLENANEICLLDAVVNARPTTLIGVSGIPGPLSEAAIRAMARHVDRPIIFPLSNPTSRSEATAEQIITWTDGRALAGTGSPSTPVEWQGRMISIDQTNSSHIFPGMGLGIRAAGARRVTDAMFMVGAKVIAGMSPAATEKLGRLLPPVHLMRSVAVARDVARQAQADGVAEKTDAATLDARIVTYIWEPRYHPYRKAG